MRVLAIIGVIAFIGLFGCWLGGPRGLSPWPVRSVFPVVPDDGVRSDGGAIGLMPGDTDVMRGPVPLWPADITLLERAQIERPGVEGAIFTVEGSKRQEVVDYYRSLLFRNGWHALRSGEKEAEKLGLSAEGVYAFVGEGGTFFLGYNTDAATVHFVTMRLPRRSD